MSLRKGLLLAMLFMIAALVVAGSVDVHNAESDVPKPNPWLRTPALAAAALPWYHNQSASFLPIQFNNPQNLSVGKLLVASRGLGDPNFAETVILLIRYDEKGVVGLVLNRRTDVPLSRVLDLKAAKDRSDPIYIGGPVGLSAVFALLQSSAKLEKAESIIDGVYLISDKDLFEQTLSDRPDPGVFRVFLGYAGWTQDQLRAEVQLGGWFIFPADAATVFTSGPDSLWLQMIHRTELQLAKTQPFAGISQPAELF
jgi:putative transcriptional regulator